MLFRKYRTALAIERLVQVGIAMERFDVVMGETNLIKVFGFIRKAGFWHFDDAYSAAVADPKRSLQSVHWLMTGFQALVAYADGAGIEIPGPSAMLARYWIESRERAVNGEGRDV